MNDAVDAVENWRHSVDSVVQSTDVWPPRIIVVTGDVYSQGHYINYLR